MTRTTHTPLAVRLGSAISEAKFEQLSSETVSRVKLSILDNIGTIAYVSTLEDCAPVLDRVREKGGRAEATVAGQSIKAPLEDASAANAFLIHAAETDESDFRASLRASPVVMAPAMATAESIGATGKDFILSLAVGYSVLGALAAPLGRLQPYGFMSVGVWGTSSAAAVSARLMGLNASQCTHALALAGGGGGGLFQYYYDQTEEKRLIVARSVRTGVEAALLARTGMVGPERIYEGEAGVYRVFGKLVGRDVSEREIDNVAEQARRWDGPLYLIPKYYAASASIIPFLDGLDELFQSRPDIRAQVANFELHIEDDPTYILAAKHKAYEHPHTIIGAKIGNPDTPVVGFAGDGAFGISMSEMSSIGREEWPAITMVIFRNYQWGAEKRNSTLWYDDNFVGTELDPHLSYARVAEACGLKGVVAKTQAQLTEAIAKSCEEQKNGVTTFIEIILNQELGEPFRRDAMKKPVVVAGIDPKDMRPQKRAG